MRKIIFVDPQGKKIDLPKKPSRMAITITYSECIENHAGMQKLGTIEKEGFTLEDLSMSLYKFEKLGAVCELHNLCDALDGTEHEDQSEEAYILIIRKGVDILLKGSGNDNSSDMMTELTAFKWDTKAFMRGQVKNKIARENVCISDESQEADYESGKGTVIPFDDVPCTKYIRTKLGEILGDKGKDLLAEGNKYNDVSVNGIGFHGDSERIKVVAVRLGASFPLHYQWFLRFNPVGERIKFILNNGDMYIMSHYATGNNWKQSSKLTLRHAAGANKYLTIKPKKEKL